MGRYGALVAALSLVAACSSGVQTSAPSPSTPAPMLSSTSPSPSPTPTTTPTQTPSSTPTPTRTPSPKPSASTPRPSSSLKGDTRNSWAFAPLSNPSGVVVEGSVPSSKAYSTSKVLIVAAFLDTVVDGDPKRLSSAQRSLITRALTASDGDAVLQLQYAIPGGPAAAGSRILRAIGDRQTVVPNSRLGAMQWSVREQVRFMASLGNGTVVSPAASAYVLSQMQPITPHRWGLGTIGASAIKGGWLRADTETRQMGIYRGYAVAIITAHVGPAVLQTDGDSAHVAQMNALAARLKARLG